MIIDFFSYFPVFLLDLTIGKSSDKMYVNHTMRMYPGIQLNSPTRKFELASDPETWIPDARLISTTFRRFFRDLHH